MSEHTKFMMEFFAPYSPGLRLRRPGPNTTQEKGQECVDRGFHIIDIRESGGSMDYDEMHCSECDSWMDEAYFDADAEHARNSIGYDSTTYINLTKDSSRS